MEKEEIIGQGDKPVFLPIIEAAIGRRVVPAKAGRQRKVPEPASGSLFE